MFVSDDPHLHLWPRKLIDGGVLQVLSTSEVYGEERVVHAAGQHATFTNALADAIDHGYTGIRVAADNTSLVATPERLQAWLEWEQVADRFMAENPVTGLCAFDNDRTDPVTLREMRHQHRKLIKA